MSEKTKKLTKAKEVKNDEFYTQYADIQKEVNAYLDFDENVFRGKTVLLPCDDPEWSNFTKFFAQNFERFGLKKLISTSFAPEAKSKKYGGDMSLYAYAQENNGGAPDNERGRIYVLDHDTNRNGRIDIEDLEWEYLKGDGDFRSDEVRRLRDEADVIVTNPPFSIFLDFFTWLMESKKQFLVLCNKGAVSYKEVFPYIRGNKIWAGRTEWAGGMWFETIDETDVDKVIDGKKMKNVASVWLTNIEHGRRHLPLLLMTMAENIKHSSHKDVKDVGYLHYDNYDAIDIPHVDSIPSDYDGVMGVPISFLDKYCPEQFKLIGIGTGDNGRELGVVKNYRGRTDLAITENGKHRCPFTRILIQRKKSCKATCRSGKGKGK